jgi:peptidoglycan pentaglycine glycine transferase (the first glycine)
MTHPWNELIAALPNPHFLQTYEWGQVKAAYGWQPLYLVWDEAGFSVSTEPITIQPSNHPTLKAAALVLKKTVPTGGLAARLSVLYAPKGPLLDWDDLPLRTRVIDDLQRFARQQGGIFLKLDPDVVLGTGVPGTETDIVEPGGEAVREELSRRGWRFSSDQIQFRNTVIVEVGTSTQEEILARMKQKTRYNVRLGPKKGVFVRIGNQTDWPMLYKMYAETSLRDGFVIRDEAYYRKVWSNFDNSEVDNSIFDTRTSNIEYRVSNSKYRTSNIPLAQPLIAEVNGEPVAAIVVFAFAGRAYYVYGMSREAHREKMPTYLLQWEAMKWARARGCATYDLWGAPEMFDERDSMWGVFRFKDGLGGQVVRTLGAWDYAPNPLWYGFYTRVMPKILGALRSLGRRKMRQDLGG